MMIATPELDQDRLLAMREYMINRRRGMDPRGSVEASTYCGADNWFHTDSWELAYRAVATGALLADESMTGERELLAAKKRRLQVDAIVDELHDAATDPQSDYHEKRSAQTVFLKYAAASHEMAEQVEETRRRASLRFAEQMALPRWVEERARIETMLRESYAGKGPQYELLCDRLTDTVLLLKVMQATPVAIDLAEYQRMNNQVVALVNQLQKFTEATKTQAISTQINEALARLMAVIEEIVAPANPVLWKKIVDEITRRVNGITTGEVPQLYVPEKVAGDGDGTREWSDDGDAGTESPITGD